MRTFFSAATVAAGIGLAALAGATGASAQSAPRGQNCTTPPGMNYMICDGRRVPKPGNRVATGDGGWREEVRQGSCVTIREKIATGEYKESRRCD